MSAINNIESPPNVGAVIRGIRQSRGLSLDETSRLTGVSKAMLGQIERGESSPTVSTLWKISTGLRVTFSTLMEPTAPAIQPPVLTVLDIQKMEPVYEAGGKVILHDILPFDPAAGFEVFSITVKPGCHYTSPSHRNVVEEYVLVVEGTLTLTVEEHTVPLTKGMLAKFPGPADHAYANEGNIDAVFHNIIRY